MTEVTSPTVKKSIRARKTAATASVSMDTLSAVPQASNLNETLESFTILLEKINKTKGDFEKLQKETFETKEAWTKEKKQHGQEVLERNSQEELKPPIKIKGRWIS